jgi:hypothetical protein
VPHRSLGQRRAVQQRSASQRRTSQRRAVQQRQRAQQRAVQRRQEQRRAAQRRQDQRQERRQQRAQDRRQEQRAQRITPQRAREGRFAARFNDRRVTPPRRVHRLPPRHAWRRGWFAFYVPWFGALFWPYVYADLFFYPFWPYAYDDGYWAYAYDDFFDGIFFPDGYPYASYANAGPYDAIATTNGGTVVEGTGISVVERQSGSATTGRSARASAGLPGQVAGAVRDLCANPASGVTAWPFDSIERAVNPNGEQRALLDDLKRAAGEAADRFRQACPQHVPMTPTGRLAAMTERLQATLEAVRLVRPPLEKFYQSLSDEQQARFNAIGPNVGQSQRQQAAAGRAQGDCGGDKEGITAVPIDRIEAALNPTGEQGTRLDKLSDALARATDILAKACPDFIPQTPVGRLAAMQQRLEAMVEAANTVRPPLEDFYASLDSEQKARFNRLGRTAARAGR